jgi:hypothetical protein
VSSSASAVRSARSSDSMSDIGNLLQFVSANLLPNSAGY